MSFPIEVNARIDSSNRSFNRKLLLRGGLTVLIGPNGSGKTHLLRGIKLDLETKVQGRKVRFLSAGRMALLEQYRSDFDGRRGGRPSYDDASFGSKKDVSRRHLMESLKGDFQTLSERADILIKIQERLRKLFQKDLIIEWDGGNLKVMFARLDDESEPYSSAREASGLLHLVGILAALYDDEVGALLLDEPEVSLHPQLQAFLLNEITTVAGYPNEDGFKKIVVMATHSTQMLKISNLEDLLSLVFCYDLGTDPIQIDPELDELKNKKLQSLIVRLGQEHKLSLFSRRPLLVEGPSDVMLCSFVSNKLEYHLEAAGSQILPVVGKGQMVVVSKLMRLLGKDPVVLADADAIADGVELTNYFLSSSEIANQKAVELGAPSAMSLASSIYSDFCQLVDKKWGNISLNAKQHPYWVNRTSDGSRDMEAKRRSCFCILFELDDSEISNLDNGEEWLAIKKRIIVLLDLLELTGCFVLRKGAIESYYQGSNRFAMDGKPIAAVEEIEYLKKCDDNDIIRALGEIVRCVKFSSLGEIINEVDSLKDLLLSIAAPVLAKLNSGVTTQDVRFIARSILGERAKIFNVSVLNNEIVIDIDSNILNVQGFPLKLKYGDNVIEVVEQALGDNE